MVRINLLHPSCLADQHLIAEYNEILMLLGYVRKFPEEKNIPPTYRLGKGHITFFKNKLEYLRKRHAIIKKEMRKRGFATEKTIDLKEFPVSLQKNWSPTQKDVNLIKKRLEEKIMKRPGYYRYSGVQKPSAFFLKLIKEATLPECLDRQN